MTSNSFCNDVPETWGLGGWCPWRKILQFQSVKSLTGRCKNKLNPKLLVLKQCWMSTLTVLSEAQGGHLGVSTSESSTATHWGQGLPCQSLSLRWPLRSVEGSFSEQLQPCPHLLPFPWGRVIKTLQPCPSSRYLDIVAKNQQPSG